MAKFWLEEVGIGGWRLDVAHEIEPDFWREFRRVTDSVSKDCLLVGEMIHGNYNDWVGHDRLHSGTNYQMSRLPGTPSTSTTTSTSTTPCDARTTCSRG